MDYLNRTFLRRLVTFFLNFTFFFIGISAFAQEKSIRLLDEKTDNPVVDVYYKYKNHSGISNQKGEIHLIPAEGETLYLSHLQYGKISLSAKETRVAFENGILRLAHDTRYLLPVTTIAVHKNGGEKGFLDVTAQEKLEHDAGYLLEQVSGVSVIKKSGSYGFDPVMRGFKYDQLNLVVDGSQTASAACPNRMDPAASQIPINMISKIEIMKGPFSLRYGNAFGGTINFISSKPQFSEKVKPVGRLGTSYESNGNVLRTEGVAGLTGKTASLKLFGSYSQGSDYNDGNGLKIPANFNRLNWGGKLGFKVTERQNISLLASNNRAKDVDFPALPMDMRDDNTWLFNAAHNVYFYNKMLTSWNTTAYYTKVNHLMDNFGKAINPRTVDAETTANTSNYGGRSEFRFDFKNTQLFSGIDYRFESADGYRTRSILAGAMKDKTFDDNVWQDAQILRAGIFSEYHLEVPDDYHFIFSGRLDFNSARSNNADPKFSELFSNTGSTYLNPSFSAGGTKLLGEAVSLGLWFGTAQRSPGIAERYINFFPIGLDPYEMIGNPQLKPERNNQIDLIFEYGSLNTNFNINLFTSFLRNYISSEIDPNVKPKLGTSPGVRRFVNIDRALISGFEMVWEQSIMRNLRHGLSLVYTYGENQVLNEPLPEIPPMEFKYRLMGKFWKAKIQPEILFRQVLKQDRIALSYGETETPSFNVVDAKVSWLANGRITATFGIQNIFDASYYEHLSRSVRGPETRPIYSPGRSFFATLTLNFL